MLIAETSTRSAGQCLLKLRRQWPVCASENRLCRTPDKAACSPAACPQLPVLLSFGFGEGRRARDNSQSLERQSVPDSSQGEDPSHRTGHVGKPRAGQEAGELWSELCCASCGPGRQGARQAGDSLGPGAWAPGQGVVCVSGTWPWVVRAGGQWPGV